MKKYDKNRFFFFFSSGFVNVLLRNEFIIDTAARNIKTKTAEVLRCRKYRLKRKKNKNILQLLFHRLYLLSFQQLFNNPCLEKKKISSLLFIPISIRYYILSLHHQVYPYITFLL